MIDSIVVLDDFYDNPDAIRHLALQQAFARKPNATYPGVEAFAADVDWEPVRRRMAESIPCDVSGPCPKNPPFRQGKFRIAVAADDATRLDGVHEDVQAWSGVVYLTPLDRHQRYDAVAFYRHRATGLCASSDTWWLHVSATLDLANLSASERQERYWAYMRDMSQWETIAQVENRYNRALLLFAQRFHGSVGLFGTVPENARLTQHFEFYEPPQRSGDLRA